QILRAQPPMVHAVVAVAPHADDAAVLDCDIHRVAVGVQDRGGGHPGFHVILADTFGEVHVHPDRPLFARSIRGASAPGLRDAVDHIYPFCRGPRRPRTRSAVRTEETRESAGSPTQTRPGSRFNPLELLPGVL